MSNTDIRTQTIGATPSIVSSDRKQTREEMYEEGLKIRKHLVGAETTEKAIAAADDFLTPFHEYLNEACFGSIWARPGLTWRERSMIVLALLTALNRPNEIVLHTKAALKNGVTELEIREVLMQSMCYAGIPNGVGAFASADKALKEVKEEKK